MMISSIDLFFSLDCGVGFGPLVDAPKLVPLATSSVLAPAGACVLGCAVPEPALGGAPKRGAGAAVAEVPDVVATVELGV